MILVSGSNGFVGGNVVSRLARKQKVIGVDIGKQSLPENAISVKADLTNPASVDDISRNDFDTMVHCAAIISPKQCQANPRLAYMTNLLGTLNMLEAARKKDVKRFVYISTGGIYKNSNPSDKVTEDWPIVPRGFYAITKMTAERTISEYCKDHGLNAVAFRITAPYGRGMIKPGTNIGIPDALHRHTLLFAIRALKNKDIIMPYGGDHTVNYTFIDDIVNGVECAINSNLKGFEPFNLTSGRLISIRELGEAFGKVNSRIKVDIGAGDLMGSSDFQDPLLAPLAIMQGLFDVSKAEKMIGYKPQYSLEHGAAQLVEYLKTAGVNE